jgi:hypothetical protein
METLQGHLNSEGATVLREENRAEFKLRIASSMDDKPVHPRQAS